MNPCRDIKPRNILLHCSETDFDWNVVNTSLLTVKLCDFGVSRSFEDLQRHRDDVTVTGTLAFVPPEFLDAMIKNLKEIPLTMYVKNIDTWATGIVAYMMHVGYLPREF